MRFTNALHSALATLGIASFLAAAPALANVNVFVQPQGLSVASGSNATFTASVTVTAGEAITGYTWLMSPSNQNPFTTVATGQSVTITNAHAGDTGYYFVRVAWMSGANSGVAVSTSVLLSVQDAARVTGEPVPLTQLTGGNAAFNLTASGTQPLGYVWRLNGANLADGPRISGSASSNLTIVNLSTNDAGNYDAVVTNVYGADTSSVAVLTVLAPPFFNPPPQDLTVFQGSGASFTAVPGGTAPFTFQWQEAGVNLTNGGRISGATTATLSISATVTNDTGNYSVILANVAGSITSAVARLTVQVPPVPPVPPVITSAPTAAAHQGILFNYTITATGTLPITFGATGLPAGLSVDPILGVISGIPTGFGVFNLTLYATNAATTANAHLTLTTLTAMPGITSALATNVQQGQFFAYAILASNNPTFFSAIGLPLGVHLDPATGIISGPPVVTGVFPVTISAGNAYGADTQILTLTVASAIPVITSALTVYGLENQPGFQYTITASNSPTQFGAAGLPSGFIIDPNTGIISGTPNYGGTNNVVIWAQNAWGCASETPTRCNWRPSIRAAGRLGDHQRDGRILNSLPAGSFIFTAGRQHGRGDRAAAW